MTVPVACQPIADQIDELRSAKKDLQDTLPGLAGQERWEVLSQIAQIEANIKKSQKALDQCVIANAPGYRTEVDVFDLSSSVVLPFTCRLWQLVPPTSQNLDETRQVQGGIVTFANGGSYAGTSIGVSVHDDPGSVFTGAMFRSGPLSSLPPGAPADPAGLIEIGVPTTPPLVTAATITAGLPALPMTVPVAGPFGVTSVTITSITPIFGPGTITLTIGATTTAILGITLPFAYTLTVSLAPSLNMNVVTEICVVTTPGGPGTLATPLGSFFSTMLGVIGIIIEPRIRAMVVATVQTALNAAILAAAATAIGQAALPPGVVLSMRRVVVTSGGIVLFPAFGAFGGLFDKIPIP